ncbi:hypothetical protein K1719_006039 [Acacia pycnantha]|nr:hypothetical protein K1719_006039 [Acacia pycnantha]
MAHEAISEDINREVDGEAAGIFNPKAAKIESVVAWVRLPDLPAPLFDKKFLLNLGNSIGRAIRLDVHTVQRARRKFARMCVELDLTKPLIPEFMVEGQTLSIVYESLGCLCTKCGMIGHRKKVCGVSHQKDAAGEMDVEEYVPESNLELYKWQEARLSGKENLQPGAYVGWRRKNDDMDTGQVAAIEGEEGQIERMGLSAGEECATLALGD